MLKTNAQRIEGGDPEEGNQVRQEVECKESGKKWRWRGIAFAITLRSTKVTRTVRKARPYEPVDPYQPVRVMAMASPPAPPPDSGTTEEVTTTDKSLIIQVGPADVTPPDRWGP